MARIHPTAIIEDEVELAADVEIGPGCVLHGPIRIGAGTRLIAQVFLQGPLTLGARNRLYPGACLGYAGQDFKFDPATAGAGVLIGDDNVFREAVTVHRATGEQPTTIGDNNYLMVNAHVGHDSRLGNRVTLVNNSLVAGHVQVHDQAMLSGSAVVHQFCRVGRLALISGNEGVSMDMPPFCICYTTRRVGGLNLVGLRRAGLREHIRPLKRAFDILYRQQHGRLEAARLIQGQLGDDPLCAQLAQFVRESRRGVTGYQRPRRPPPLGAVRALDAGPDEQED